MTYYIPWVCIFKCTYMHAFSGEEAVAAESQLRQQRRDLGTRIEPCVYTRAGLLLLAYILVIPGQLFLLRCTGFSLRTAAFFQCDYGFSNTIKSTPTPTAHRFFFLRCDVAGH